jgi:anti-anti-sigma factor
MTESAAFRIRRRAVGETALVEVAGECDLARAQALESELMLSFLSGCRDLVVDLRETTFFDLAALRALREARHAVESFGGKLHLIPSQPVMRLLEIVRTETHFVLSESLEDSLRRIAADAATRARGDEPRQRRPRPGETLPLALGDEPA